MSLSGRTLFWIRAHEGAKEWMIGRDLERSEEYERDYFRKQEVKEKLSRFATGVWDWVTQD